MNVPQIRWTDGVELPAARTALLVVDMQNDFVDPRGALPVPAAAGTVGPIAALLARAREAGVPVLYTQDWHLPDDPEFRIWPPHCVAGTWGAEVVDALAPRPGETRIRKTTYDPFFRTPLEPVLDELGVEEVVIVGTVANICVLHAAASAALRGIRPVVPRDGVSALTEFDLHLAFHQVASLYRGVPLAGAEGARFVPRARA
ncbi:MAG: Nicotinamidase [Candidatus Bipolaricaulis sibiricus]|uniref:Nicotinamidase n=1 Tax=Bipolaricaulis sibiricus TaxID=2501609 RepID=A0A410FWD1_BIPS1|nr:MAG: Nicotinamidase [Candidatus Bipolaricaulis sibiricus]